MKIAPVARINFLLITMLPMLMLLGCNDSGPIYGDVEGAVTFDGKPVEEGMIMFTPERGVEGAPTVIVITKGRYTSSEKGRGVPVGPNAVYISGERYTGKKGKDLSTGQEYEEAVELIPEKYNEKTTLYVKVERGNNTFDFQLEPGGRVPSRR